MWNGIKQLLEQNPPSIAGDNDPEFLAAVQASLDGENQAQEQVQEQDIELELAMAVSAADQLKTRLKPIKKLLKFIGVEPKIINALFEGEDEFVQTGSIPDWQEEMDIETAIGNIFERHPNAKEQFESFLNNNSNSNYTKFNTLIDLFRFPAIKLPDNFQTSVPAPVMLPQFQAKQNIEEPEVLAEVDQGTVKELNDLKARLFRRLKFAQVSEHGKLWVESTKKNPPDQRFSKNEDKIFAIKQTLKSLDEWEEEHKLTHAMKIQEEKEEGEGKGKRKAEDQQPEGSNRSKRVKR